MVKSQARGGVESAAYSSPDGEEQKQSEEYGSLVRMAFRNLSVYGFENQMDQQKTFLNYPLTVLAQRLGRFLPRSQKVRLRILHSFEAIVSGGEMTLVLGRPGSGCTTLLKTLTGDTYGLCMDPDAMLSYQGISLNNLRKMSRGEYIYVPESDTHFPHLTVKQTLLFAAQSAPVVRAHSSEGRLNAAAASMKETVEALNLGHTLDTKVGNTHIKGISGGERRRTSIAEVLVGAHRLQCWDNSVRGLDSANALRFVQNLRSSARGAGTVVFATLYQASEDIYDCFDKVIVLYDGREIFFGSIYAAKDYFVNLGFSCHDRSTTADFLCSVTNPLERAVRQGHEGRVPRNAVEFAEIWNRSQERNELSREIQSYAQSSHLRQNYSPSPFCKVESTLQHSSTPYKMTFFQESMLCLTRSFQRLLQDLTPPTSGVAGNAIISIILGSMFYNMPDDTSSFFGRGVLLFFTILTNTLLASFEGVQLWDQRPIVEKHYRYAFYHRSAEAVASMLCDLPNKFLLTTCFNVPFYFLANMRRTPAAFFTFYLFAFVSLLTGSMLYRTIGAMSRTLTASIAPGSIFILLLVIYTGFVLPIPSMRPWFRWFAYLNPVGYAFESLMINEFYGRSFPCASFVPEGTDYAGVGPYQRMCSVTGATVGEDVVDGASYIATTFQYYPHHLWRNLGILVGIMTFLCCLYLLATELLSAQRSKGEVVIFRRRQPIKSSKLDDYECQHSTTDIAHSFQLENEDPSTPLEPKKTQAATFLWDSLSYEIKTSKGSLKLLDDIEGWIEPGTVTALMGESGAGKTTLLNVLANRAGIGVVGGETLVDAKFRNEGFARKVGYAQQEDLAMPTATVRETLVFSAKLRQSPEYTESEKLAYVEEVIAMLDLTKLADAIVGIPGEGLNIEQRKRLTIGIELAARPELLLFLDEPTSGLDSNTAWSICRLLRRLADTGQAILCTIHQPSGTAFEMFDRLLFIQNGRSIYFGHIGPSSRTIIEYFSKQSIAVCKPDDNPAEWLMSVTGTNGLNAMIDWPQVWARSTERRAIKEKLAKRKTELRAAAEKTSETTSSTQYAASYYQQLYQVTKRNFEQEWRTPSYLYSKLFLALGSSIVNGFSFYKSLDSLQGIQNQIFSVFLLFTLHSSLVQLVIPRFLGNRSLYELKERPSRTYRWDVFLISNIISEIPSQTILAVILFVGWYYPLGMYRNAISPHGLNERGGLMFLLMWSYMLFSSTFSQMVATVMPDAATGVNISSLLYSLSLLFCGVLVIPDALPRFWIFMYRATPITYLVGAMISSGLAGANVQCSTDEILKFDPPNGEACGPYLENFNYETGARLLNPSAQQGCQLCLFSTADSIIARFGMFYDDRWKNFAISLVYSIFNVVAALILYWLFRVPKGVRLAKRHIIENGYAS